MHPNWFVILVILLAAAPLLAALWWVTASRCRDARRARIAERMGAAYESEPEPGPDPEPVLEQASPEREPEPEPHDRRHPNGQCDCWDDTAVYYLRGGVPLAPRREPLRSSSPLPPPGPPRVRAPIAAAAPPPPPAPEALFPPAPTQPVRSAPPVPPVDQGGSGRAFVPRPPQAQPPPAQRWHTGRHERLPVGVTSDAARQQQRWSDEYAEPVRRPRHRLDD